MNEQDEQAFRAQIVSRLVEIATEDSRGQEARNIVTLDQQAVGRLSRMDALQSQAMAKAQQARRISEAAQLRAALDRLDRGDYGACEDCGEDIPLGRLRLDLTARRCVSCTAG